MPLCKSAEECTSTNTQTVAEATSMLMLATLRNLADFDRACRVGNGWSPEGVSQEKRNALGELCGRIVGFVGSGAVASRLVGSLRALGVRVIYTNRSGCLDLDIERRDLDNLLGEPGVVVSLHVASNSGNGRSHWPVDSLNRFRCDHHKRSTAFSFERR
jgi:phosphoglycerate dehydrogenase-like enzyme